jgi:hypothetical protein
VNKSVGSIDNPVTNPDGSVDVYFGPKVPKGKEKNWVPTNPHKGFFLVFRFYGPLEGYINKTWVLNDLELIERSSGNWRMSKAGQKVHKPESPMTKTRPGDRVMSSW